MIDFEIKKVSPSEINKNDLFSRIFGYEPPKDWEPDFLLIAHDEMGSVMAFTTCKNLGTHSVFSQFGGVMPDLRGTGHGIEIGKAFRDYLFGMGFGSIQTRCRNDNAPVIIDYLKAGGRVVGVLYLEGELLIQIAIQRENKWTP